MSTLPSPQLRVSHLASRSQFSCPTHNGETYRLVCISIFLSLEFAVTDEPLLSSELERQANIARNVALLEELNVKEAAAGLISRKVVEKDVKSKSKPVQPRVKRARAESAAVEPRRQSLRLRKEVADPNESPAKKRRREASNSKSMLSGLLTQSPIL